MKKVKVKYLKLPKHPIATGMLLENTSDANMAFSEIYQAEARIITKFVTSGESPSRYDHVVAGLRSTEMPLAILATTYARMFKESNPIYHLPNARNRMIQSIGSLLLKGPVFINENGGITPLSCGDGSAYLEVVEVISESTKFEAEVKYRVSKNTKYLNLENAWQLEKSAKEFLRKRDGSNYSYITEMSALSDSRIEQIMTEFVNAGGTHIYVYTTGQNHKQMYEYSKTALSCGVKDFVFEFNSGTDQNITEFVQWLSQRANVELIN